MHYTASVNLANLTVTFTGDEASDLLVFSLKLGKLRHNRFGLDPGFASDTDLDTSLAGTQSASSGNGIFVNAGLGDDTVTLGDATTPVSDFETPFIVDGQGGTDRFNLDDTANSAGTGVTPATLRSTDFENFFFYSNIESLVISGGSGNDDVTVDSTADTTATTLFGGGGDDHATVNAVGVAGLTLDGQVGNDSVTINFGALNGPVVVVDYGVSIDGTAGDDTLVLTGTQLQRGSETIDLGATDQPTVSGGEGNDTIDASASTKSTVLDGGSGNDSLTGGALDDTLTGGPGDDTIGGGAGMNKLVESADVDFALSDNGLIGLGTDSLSGIQEARLSLSSPSAARGFPMGRSVDATAFTGKLEVIGSEGGDSILGGAGPDLLNGMGGDDTVAGGAGNDVLLGVAGDDSLAGGENDDLLNGGPGGDILEDDLGTNSLIGGTGCDTVNSVADPPACAFPNVEFNASNFTVGEAGRTATITVTLANAVATPSSVAYTITNGTATAPGDYTLRNGTLTFSPGLTTRTFTIAIRNDKIDEDDETINVALSNPTGSINLGDLTTATLTIVDDDATPSLRFKKTAGKVREAVGIAPVIVSLSAASGRPVSVDYTTIDDSAEAGSDYSTVTNTLIFLPGQRTLNILVPITNDSSDEPNQTFFVQLSHPVNATLPATTALATLTILDDDPTPRAAIHAQVVDSVLDSGDLRHVLGKAVLRKSFHV